MRLTHFGHACVLVEIDAGRVLVDPGAYSSGYAEERDLDAILITHQHPDHVDVDALRQLIAANPNAELLVDHGTAEQLSQQSINAGVVRAGDHTELGGIAVDVVGGDHAVIHPDLPGIPNVGYVFAHGAFYHPGDSLHVPEQRIDTLGLPTGAPWLKAAEAVEFFRAVAPRVAVPIHEAVLAFPQMHYRLFENLGPSGAEFRVLEHGQSSDV